MHFQMDEDAVGQVSVRFLGEDGNELGGAGILLPTSVTSNQLQILCNQLLDSRLVSPGSPSSCMRNGTTAAILVEVESSARKSSRTRTTPSTNSSCKALSPLRALRGCPFVVVYFTFSALVQQAEGSSMPSSLSPLG